MSSDQNQPDDPIEADPAIGEESGSTIDSGLDDTASEMQSPDDSQVDETFVAVDDPAIPHVDPVIGMLGVDSPAEASTVGTGTSIAVGCTALFVVILLITILILTIVS